MVVGGGWWWLAMVAVVGGVIVFFCGGVVKCGGVCVRVVRIKYSWYDLQRIQTTDDCKRCVVHSGPQESEGRTGQDRTDFWRTSPFLFCLVLFLTGFLDLI